MPDTAKKNRATVTISARVPRQDPAHRGGHRQLWAYGYEDLAVLFGVHVVTARRFVAEKRFDPGDIMSVFAYYDALRAQKGKKKP